MIPKVSTLIVALGASAIGATAAVVIAGASNSGSQQASTDTALTVSPAADQVASTDSPIPAPTLPADHIAKGRQISSDFVVKTIEAQFATQSSSTTSVVVTCPRDGNFASVAGDSFVCTYNATSVSAQSNGQIEVDVTTAQSNWSWKVL